ncbi:hypothetical protein SAMN05421736_10690 [Evansella caseinilytica]|uniref:Uncharacterized protein n=1 Tax=Evansella caseinilytica TaxID=1503961 RepID=A0A1H3QB74_9BACI|nr:hypothetical protein [Evansella caseinilytica]SDZ10381.1 hypothetical protein SAMN05421736_10690 [Evansella caseinilytica]
MHSFQTGYEWFSQSQDDDIPLLLTGRERQLGGIELHRAEPLPFGTDNVYVNLLLRL